MRYKCRPGIVCVNICGENMLVPTRAASETVPNVMRLSLIKAALWEEIEKGRDGTVVVKFFKALTRKPEGELQERVDKALEEMYEKGYLILADEAVS